MRPLFIHQRDRTDCGVTCLLSVIRMHGGDASLETLRVESGTNVQGTSLLGLQQCALKHNLKAEAFEVEDIDLFKGSIKNPCILHIVIDDKLEHYVICYEVHKDSFRIIDPASGIHLWTKEELLGKWKSRIVLFLEPEEQFEKVGQVRVKQLAWLRDMITDDLPLLYIAATMGILITLLGMANAIFTQQLIDQILPKHQTSKLWLGITLLVIVLIIRGGINYFRTSLLLRQSRDFNNRLMSDFYSKLLHLPKSFFETRKLGEVIARMNDTRRIQSVISFLAGNMIIDFLLFSTSVIFIFFYSWKIGLMVLSGIPVTVWLLFYFNRIIVSSQKEALRHYALTESHFIDAIGGISEIKSSNKESFFSAVGNKIYSNFQEKLYHLGMSGSIYGFWNEILNAVFLTGILAYSSYLVLQKQLQPGEMMAIISIAFGMVGATLRLVNANVQIQEAKIAFERMYEFAGIVPESKFNGPEDERFTAVRSVHIEDLSFGFAGKSRLLRNISLRIRKGEINMIMGEVGSGKSLLIQILQKFHTYDSGKILINGEIDLQTISSSQWRKHLGVVPQDIKIFSGSLLDNIVLGNVAEEMEKVITFCREWGFSRFFEQLPAGYMTIVGEDGVKLSGGQKQLLALARALYRDPDLILLDEPTSAMDLKTEEFVMNLLDKQKDQKLILMVTHRDSTIPYAGNIYIIEDGVSFASAVV